MSDPYSTSIRGFGRTLPQADAFRRACSDEAARMADEIYQQGQRDREQGWPDLSYYKEQPLGHPVEVVPNECVKCGAFMDAHDQEVCDDIGTK